MADGGGHDYRIAVLDRTLDVIEALAAAAEPIGVSDIARTVGATKSATWRILLNLEARGYATKDAAAKYTLGPALFALVLRGGDRTRLVQLARPHLQWLNATFEETANLGVMEGDALLYIDIIESPHDLRMAARIGARDLLHATALGRAIVAFLPEHEQARLLEGPLEARTPRTIVDPARLRAMLDDVRTGGISAEEGENETAASCFGVPVFGPEGKVVAAISLSGPSGRMERYEPGTIQAALRRAGQAVTLRIGGQWPEFDPVETG